MMICFYSYVNLQPFKEEATDIRRKKSQYVNKYFLKIEQKDLTALEEAALFVDINDNLMSMNTSHLYHLLTRFTPSEDLASDKPAEDPKSPFHGIIYLGGEKEKVGSVRLWLVEVKGGHRYFFILDNIIKYN